MIDHSNDGSHSNDGNALPDRRRGVTPGCRRGVTPGRRRGVTPRRLHGAECPHGAECRCGAERRCGAEYRRGTRRSHGALFTLVPAAAIVAGAAALTGCDAGAPSADAPSTVVVTATTTPGPPPRSSSANGTAGSTTVTEGASSPAGDSGDGSAGGTPGGTTQRCGVDPSAATIVDHVGEVPPPSHAGMSWVYMGDSNYDPCAALSYATVEQSEQGNAQFQNQLMLFHDGEYLGVGATVPEQHQVIGTSDDSVTVRYKDWEALDAAGQPNAMAGSFTTDVTFRWNGSEVVPEGRIPNQGR